MTISLPRLNHSAPATRQTGGMKTAIIIAVCAAAVSLTGIVSAQEKPNAEPKPKIGAGEQAADAKPDAATLAQLGKIMAHLLDTLYVSPEIGSRLARQVEEKFSSGGYGDAGTPAQLAEMVTADLSAWASDRHLYLRHKPSGDASESILAIAEWEKKKPSGPGGGGGPGPMPMPTGPGGPMGPGGPGSAQSAPSFEAKMLGDGIGYLKTGMLAGGEGARAQAAEAMAALAASKAIILDLRDCPGGSVEMVNFLASYFFDAEPRVLMNRYMRPTDQHIQSKTLADIPGKRMPEVDLYILTSSRTASAGESLSYTLQQYGRAKIVGETTAGAGYNNMVIPLGKGFVFSVSVGRPEHPLSGKGWEAVGVQPDIKVAAADALEAAQRAAAARG